ncbi:hypothetical protein [Mycobacterium sp. ACS4331]|uniref:Rv1815 family serine proteinase n=1 Tax=Mycobacterium sp. ACS4331 TaxID=1834121 RepID=UPI0007FB8B4A|nr:hypothetical protein [Mycobacterium sp. ACS4331]OBF19540.1 hypothetical protein A5727_10435 [Mycobacterium sp. ACS4331]
MRSIAAVCSAVTSAVGALLLATPAVPAAAAPVLVHPGMEIRHAANVCTLGYVDPVLRVAFTAGHCRGEGPVTDASGVAIGSLAAYRDNTPNGATVRTEDLIADYGAIVLNDDVAVNNILPGGRALESEPGRVPAQGQPICHFGIITGESCGTVERVNNGWFTMANGVVSQKGDSGGPVYVLDGDRAVLVGIFNSTWGGFPAAVSWEATSGQVSEDVGVVNTASFIRPVA